MDPADVLALAHSRCDAHGWSLLDHYSTRPVAVRKYAIGWQVGHQHAGESNTRWHGFKDWLRQATPATEATCSR